jgi:hypothetical protein
VNRTILLPGSDVPNWFSHQTIEWPIERSVSLHVPSLSNGEIQGLLVCVVVLRDERRFMFPGSIIIKSRQNIFELTSYTVPFFPETESDHLCLSHIPLRKDQAEIASGKEIEVDIMSWKPIEVKKCGIHLLLVDEPNIINKHASVVQYVHQF